MVGLRRLWKQKAKALERLPLQAVQSDIMLVLLWLIMLLL